MREDVQFLDHVVFPDDVGVGRVLVLLGLDPLVAVGEAVDVGADDLAAVADVVDAVALDGGRRADALLRPVVDLAAGQLVVDRLPEELAGLLVEAHQDALVDGSSPCLVDVALVARLLVVGADEDLAAGDDRPAVGAAAERRPSTARPGLRSRTCRGRPCHQVHHVPGGVPPNMVWSSAPALVSGRAGWHGRFGPHREHRGDAKGHNRSAREQNLVNRAKRFHG